MRFSVLSTIVLVALAGPIRAQQPVPLDFSKWEIDASGSRFEEYLGRPSLYLKGGLAIVKGSQFTDGIIEFDVAFGRATNFVGAVFRLRDFKNHEQFYLRPHRSGEVDANQYQPLFNGIDSYQLCSGEGYSVPTKYEWDQWTHIKIVVSGNNADIYIKDMATPALFVELKRERAEGRVGVFDATETPAHFSNFSFTDMKDVNLRGSVKKAESTEPGTVMQWHVSSSFNEKLLEGKYVLTLGEWEKLTWQNLSSDKSGVANLARLQGLENGNTVFTRFVITSDIDQVKRMRFGFSDRVKVYLNSRLIYGGNNNYGSRDYRFVGTIGLFDELYLPLVKGDNDLWLAVSENFGGWGVKAAFENMDHIEIQK